MDSPVGFGSSDPTATHFVLVPWMHIKRLHVLIT
jgi:hypothetical protein